MPAKRKPAVTELRRRAERLAALSGSWRSEAGWEHHPWQCTKKTLDRSPNFQISQPHLSTSRGARNAPCPGAPGSLGCSMISRCFPGHPYTCVHDLPQQKVRQCQTEDHWEPLSPFPTNGSSLGQQFCAPQPKDSPSSPHFSASSILTRAVRIIILHLLSQNRAGALPRWSKHIHQSTRGQQQVLGEFCWQGLWHRQCLPWWALRG